MLKLLITLLWLPLLSVSSCKNLNRIPIQEMNASVIELILQDDYSGAVKEEVLLIKNQKSLQSFFAKINRTRKPGLPIPEIDFQKDMLLIFCEGETTMASLGLGLEKETAEAYVLSKISPKKKAKNSAVTSPFLVYKLPLSDKKVIVE